MIDSEIGAPPRAIRAEAQPRTRLLGGAIGNNRLTSIVGLILLIGLAVEGATIPSIHQLLSMHVFVGMLLLGPLALKLASTGYRFLRYYTGDVEYVRLGPPVPLMRFLVAPVLVLSTLTLFGSGVTLLIVPHRGAVLGLHKASFVVWFGAMTIHVLAYTTRAAHHTLADLSGRVPGGQGLRLLVAGIAMLAGIAIAVATLPARTPVVPLPLVRRARRLTAASRRRWRAPSRRPAVSARTGQAATARRACPASSRGMGSLSMIG